MTKLYLDISVSLDGFVAGADPTMDDPIGDGGLLHEWFAATRAFRKAHGKEGGETGIDDDVAVQTTGRAGATIMGRRMFSGGEGSWESDGNAGGWWGDEPPFGHSLFVLTHHEREPVEKADGTTYNFVADGIESALEQARAAAGDRDVSIGGGADVAQQYLRAGLVDELTLHVVPVLLGSGRRLFEGHLDGGPARLRQTMVVDSPTGVVHVRYEGGAPSA